MKDADEDEQPSIELTRKILGELAVKPAEVTAGREQDFKITYKASDALVEDDVIEVRLPATWTAPTAFNYNLDNKLENTAPDKTLLADALAAALLADTTLPHVYLSGPISRIKDHDVIVEGNAVQGSIVKIVLGVRGVSKGGTIVLEYKGVTVQRMLTTDEDPALVEAFSGSLDATATPDSHYYPSIPR